MFKAKDLTFKAEDLSLKAKDLRFKAKNLSLKAKNLTFKAKDLSFKAKAKNLSSADAATSLEKKGRKLFIIYFASAAVAVDSSHMTASSSASWSRFSPLPNSLNRHALTMWFMVCRRPQSQEGD